MALVTLLSSCLLAQEKLREHQFQPPPGTWTEYRVRKAEGRVTEGPDAELGNPYPATVQDAKLVLLRTPDGKHGALLADQSASGENPELNDFFLLDWMPQGVRCDDAALVWPARVAVDFAGYGLKPIPCGDLAAGATWTTREEEGGSGTLMSGLFEHGVESVDGRSGALRLKSRRTASLPGRTSLSRRARRDDAVSCTREVTFDEKSRRLLSYRLLKEYDYGRRFRERSVLEIEETSHRVLTTAEGDALSREVAALAKVLAAEENLELEESLLLLERYEKAHPGGILHEAARRLEERLKEKTRLEETAQEARRTLAAALAGRGPAPELELQSLDGKDLRLSELKGRPVVLSFGDLDSNAGQAELVFLSGLHERLAGQGLVVISVIEERRRWEPLERRVEARDLRQRVCVEKSTKAAAAYAVFQRPTWFLIDARGEIVLRRQGFLSAAAGVREEKVRELLLKPNAPAKK